jgi:heavy metal sensor kinase
MLASLPIRWRLALGYSAALAAILLLAGLGSWFAMRLSIEHALDRGLRYGLARLTGYIASAGTADPEQLRALLFPISQVSESFLVYDAAGEMIFRSAVLERGRGIPDAPGNADSTVRFRSGGWPGFPLRMAYQRLRVDGRDLTVVMAEPVTKFDDALLEFTAVLWISMPVLLVLATIAGFWLSSRALRPVQELIEGARSISARDLSRRLAVPTPQDELSRLANTLNGMLDRVEASFQQMRRFTADASHELRAPITLIRTAAEFSLLRERGREELLDSMRKILREATRTSALVDDLLWLARADSGQNPSALNPVRLAPLLRDIGDQANDLAAAKNLVVTTSPAPEEVLVLAEELALRRLLLILLDNAIKYTPAEGSIELDAEVTADWVTIAVTDTGAGIAPEDLPHIFERFWRADKARSRVSGGTGLGLSIAREIAASHSGTLTVTSELGRGSRFALTLPHLKL